MKTGEKIRQMRNAAGLSLHELADKAGLHKSNISEIENEKRFKPNLKTLERIAAALDCQVGDFFERSDEREASLPWGLHELIEDDRSRFLYRITPEEIEWMKGIRFRPNLRPSKETYLEMLSTYRKLVTERNSGK